MCWVVGGLTFLNGFHTPAGSFFFDLVPEKPLTDKGGIVALSPGSVIISGPAFPSGTVGGSFYYNDSWFVLTAGRLTGTVIPEPSEALLLAVGIAALVGFLTKRGCGASLLLCDLRIDAIGLAPIDPAHGAEHDRVPQRLRRRNTVLPAPPRISVQDVG